MTITIKLKTDNAAFEGDSRDLEIARLIWGVAHRFERGAVASGVREARPLKDRNGNTVGSVTVTGR